jgi:hypothetical protein
MKLLAKLVCQVGMTTGGRCRTSESRYHRNDLRKFLASRPLSNVRLAPSGGPDKDAIGGRSERAVKSFQLFRSNWLRSLSAIDWIMSHLYLARTQRLSATL